MTDTTYNAADLVLRYRKLREKVEEITKQQAAALRPYRDLMDKIEAAALQMLQQNDASSMRTDHGTMYQTTRTNYSVKDPGEFVAWCEANSRTDMLERRVAKKVVQAYVEETQTLPPGVAMSSDLTVNFRQ